MDDDTTLQEVGEIEDVDRDGRSYAFKKYGRWMVLSIIFGVFMTALCVIEGLDLRLGLFAFIPTFLFYASALSKVEHMFMEQFAKEHQFIYEGKQTDLSELKSKYVDFGRDRYLDDVVQGQYNGTTIKLYNYTCTVGEGKNSHTLAFTVFEASYSADFIDVIVSSKMAYNRASLFSGYSGLKQLSLEGDFNKYYTVYVPEHYEIEALEILTPDVMVYLEPYALSYSFEFVAGKLYIFASREVRKKSELENMLQFSEILTTRFVKK